MKTLYQRWRGINFVMRLAIVLILGTVLGVLFPNVKLISLLGEMFVNALKVIAPILVFVLVVSALASARAKTSISLILVLYAISTLSAALVAAIVSLAFPVKLTLVDASVRNAPNGIADVLNNLLHNAVDNPVMALATSNYLAILTWAILLGIALRYSNDTTKTVITNISSALAIIVRWIISLAPIGILALTYTAVSSSGLSVFGEYVQLVLLLVGAMALVALALNPLIVYIVLGQNPYPLVFQCLKESGLTAFFTRSSAANIPINLEFCRRLGLDRDTYALSIPLGATINMAGATVTVVIMAMAAVHTTGLAIDLPTAIILSMLAAVAALGASGVPGGSLLLIPLACSLFDIGNDVAMQVVAIGFIIGVIQDSCETVLNSSSDVLFTATAEYRKRQRAGKAFKVELAPPTLAHTLPELEGADNW
ncbi:serine/threonine transporter SstT [Betaproteobacteria bacterium]|nr:serine/threonine transporter SstT [Betaproteobacteria bacterium]GHU46640.1 serine/threonine transporter SstT [Betaproteobacteria bacterium]